MIFNYFKPHTLIPEENNHFLNFTFKEKEKVEEENLLKQKISEMKEIIEYLQKKVDSLDSKKELSQTSLIIICVVCSLVISIVILLVTIPFTPKQSQCTKTHIED